MSLGICLRLRLKLIFPCLGHRFSLRLSHSYRGIPVALFAFIELRTLTATSNLNLKELHKVLTIDAGELNFIRLIDAVIRGFINELLLFLAGESGELERFDGAQRECQRSYCMIFTFLFT